MLSPSQPDKQPFRSNPEPEAGQSVKNPDHAGKKRGYNPQLG